MCGWALGVIDRCQRRCGREFLDELQGRGVVSLQGCIRAVASGFQVFGHRDTVDARIGSGCMVPITLVSRSKQDKGANIKVDSDRTLV